MFETMMENSNCLLFFDNAPLDKQLIDYFDKFGYRIKHLHKLSQLSEETNLPAAILINWSIFQADSTIISDLYKRYPIPLLVISDFADEQIGVQMLEAGADDFLIKPLYAREVHARLNAIARRVQRSQQESESPKEILLFANWQLFPASRRIFNKANEELKLSVGEYDLLLTFLRHPHQVLDRELLLHVTKNSDLNPFDRRIDVQISRLRHKIEIDAKKPVLIKTVRNGGYVFTTDVLSIKE